MLKVFAIIHYLIADSGYVITLVKAESKEEAIKKYKISKSFRWDIGIHIEEITQDVQEILSYDNPNYEG